MVGAGSTAWCNYEVLTRKISLIASLFFLLACSTEAKVKSSADAKVDWSVDMGSGESKDKAGSQPEQVRVGPRYVHTEGYHKGQPTATLPGFRILGDGRSRVFVEISGAVPVREATAEGVIFYRFSNVHVPERVNRLSLPTTYFPTPITRVRMVQVEQDADLIIELRRRTKAKSKVRTTEFGTVLSVDFPKYSPLVGPSVVKPDDRSEVIVMRPMSDTNPPKREKTGKKSKKGKDKELIPTDWREVSAADTQDAPELDVEIPTEKPEPKEEPDDEPEPQEEPDDEPEPKGEPDDELTRRH